MNTWVYVFDEFKPLDIDKNRLFELVKKDPLELFNIVRKVLNVGKIESIKVYDTYSDPQSNELLVEYIVRCEVGEIAVKVIHSRDPALTLKKFYEYEKTKKK